MVPRLNFVIAGAPKCGTTALADYLRGHSRISMASPKEPHFFATDLPGLCEISTLEDYLRIFPNLHEQTLAVGEASTNYFCSRTALGNVYDFNPNAKVIVGVRNPVTWLPAYYSQLIRFREEDESLEEALLLQPARAAGNRIPRHNRAPQILQYFEMARFGAQLSRLYEVFPRSQVKVFTFEDFRDNANDVYQEILAFFDLPSDGREEFPVVNGARQIRTRWLATLTEKTPRSLIAAAMKAKSWLGIRRWGILDALRRMNNVERPNPPLTPTVRSWLIAELRDDVDRLSALLDRDLADEWFGRPSRSAAWDVASVQASGSRTVAAS